MTKVAFGPRTWVAASVCGPKHAYASIFLGMLLGFQKHEKGKFFAIMAKVWNESHIVWESFLTPFFPLYKAVHGTFSKYTEMPLEKPKIL